MNWLLKKFNYILLLALIITLSSSLPVQSVKAQDGQSPVYIVQPGDSLGAIAARFGVPIENLITANNINDPNEIYVGMQLVIPGLEGISGTLNTINVQVGDTLDQLSLRYQVPKSILIRLNRITSPLELYESADMIIPQQIEVPTELVAMQLKEPYHSILEAAVLSNTNPWNMVEKNNLSNSNDYFADERFYLPQSPAIEENIILKPIVDQLALEPTILVQGTTSTIHIHAQDGLELSGLLDNNELHFYQEAENTYVAYQGIYALADPGLTELTITGKNNGVTIYSFNQMVPIAEGNYSSEAITVDPSTIDPAVTQPELEQVEAITRPSTSTRYWTRPFICPVEKPVCIKSWFGTRRSYNGGPYENFHSGLDFGLCAPENTFNIYATAAGNVVFTALLTVRGNMTIIDHGWGIYTAVYHQSEIDVQVGDHVEAGQLIGLIGDTGRVTGPHLHYEIWVNGVQVNPFDWIEDSCD